MVVLAPTVGAAPFTPVKLGVFGAVATIRIYLLAVAPDAGNSAEDQFKSSWLEENGMVDKELA